MADENLNNSYKMILNVHKIRLTEVVETINLAKKHIVHEYLGMRRIVKENAALAHNRGNA